MEAPEDLEEFLHRTCSHKGLISLVSLYGQGFGDISGCSVKFHGQAYVFFFFFKKNFYHGNNNKNSSSLLEQSVYKPFARRFVLAKHFYSHK